MSKIKFTFFFLFTLLGTLTIALYINFRIWEDSEKNDSYSREILEVEQEGVNVLGSELFGYVGWLAKTDRPNHFTSFSKTKTKETIRIGAFGDSYTYGDEVAYKLDFPYLLQKLLGSEYEVLNFGNSGWGFSQTYSLWEKLGKDYQLDMILLGPGSFQLMREQNFSTSWKREPYWLHSLYIINEKDQLQRLDIDGETIQERYESYNSFVPSMNLIQYDMFAPALMHSLTHSHDSISNPFLKQRNMMDVFNRQVQNMLKETKDIKLIHNDSKLINKFKDLPFSHISHNPFKEALRSFPYALNKHYSPAGNHLIAKMYAAKIKATLNVPIKTFQLARLEPQQHDIIFDKILNIEIKIDNIPIGSFKTLNPFSYYEDDTELFKESLVTSNFVIFKGANQSLLDGFGAFFAKRGFQDEITLEQNGKINKLPLKKIINGFYYIQLPSSFQTEVFIHNRIISDKKFHLKYKDRNILESDDHYCSVPINNQSQFYRFVTKSDKLLDLDQIKPNGEITLVISDEKRSESIVLDKYSVNETQLE